MLYGVMNPVEIQPQQFQHQRFGRRVKDLATAKRNAIRMSKHAYVIDNNNNVVFHQLMRN